MEILSVCSVVAEQPGFRLRTAEEMGDALALRRVEPFGLVAGQRHADDHREPPALPHRIAHNGGEGVDHILRLDAHVRDIAERQMRIGRTSQEAMRLCPFPIEGGHVGQQEEPRQGDVGDTPSGIRFHAKSSRRMQAHECVHIGVDFHGR
ncbi:hypothetical protein DC429_13040 [Arthrobacter sp. TPD3018]|nr:hypothetical protein DC425_11945 [Sphingomonas sp. TPD3009]PVE54638.1 hypothetical protein DC429_13040 [Arthrobacter sp. TPD3018]PVE82776.1 hypothetical protein DC431_12750 [Sphingomonas melonis]